MIVVSLRTRIVLLLLITADLMAFSRITLLPLIAITIGAAAVMLGIVSSYRIASVLGMLVVIVTAAASVEIASLLELNAILTAIVALLLPIMILIWLALSAEEGERQQVLFRRKPGVIALAFGVICIWSAPLTMLTISFFAPAVAMRADILTEISIMLVVTIAGAIVLLRRKPSGIVVPKPEKSAKAS